jgi:hypothetical protein
MEAEIRALCEPWLLTASQKTLRVQGVRPCGVRGLVCGCDEHLQQHTARAEPSVSVDCRGDAGTCVSRGRAREPSRA